MSADGKIGPVRKGALFVIAAILAPPIAGAIVGAIFLPVTALIAAFSGSVTSMPTFGDIVLTIAAGGFFGGIEGAAIGWPMALVLGIPAHLALKKLGWTGPFHYALAGGVIGALALPVAKMAGVFSFELPGLMIAATAMGALAGLFFQRIRRSDLDNVISTESVT